MEKYKNKLKLEEAEQLRLLVENYEQQLGEIRQSIDIVNSKLDSAVQKIEQNQINSRFGLREKTIQKLDKIGHRFGILSILLFLFSTIFLAFLSADISELIAQISFFCISLAIISELIYFLITKIKKNR